MNSSYSKAFEELYTISNQIHDAKIHCVAGHILRVIDIKPEFRAKNVIDLLLQLRKSEWEALKKNIMKHNAELNRFHYQQPNIKLGNEIRIDFIKDIDMLRAFR